MHFQIGFNFKLVKVVVAHKICRDPPIFWFAGGFIECMILGMQAGEDGLEPDWEWLHWLCSHSGLSINVEDVGSTSGAILGGEGGNHARV